MHIPVLVSTVDHQFVRDKADFLATKGYHVLELPASFATLATVVRAILEPETSDPPVASGSDLPAQISAVERRREAALCASIGETDSLDFP
jgi:hypothetical protein